MDGICGICGKTTDETMLTVDDHETTCLECATKTAKEAQTEKRHIEIYDEHWNNWFLCTWCEELFPESELREEADLGHLCDQCIMAIHSRGESLSLKY